MHKELTAISKGVYIALYRARAELQAEATRTYVGYIWWFGEPLMMLLIYFFAFRLILNNNDPLYLPYLFIGLIFWRFFVVTIIRSATSIDEGKNLSNLVYVHKSMFAITPVLVNTVKFLASFVTVFILLALFGIYPTLNWLLLPMLILSFAFLISGLGLLFASLVPFCIDLMIIINNVMAGLMFLSCVFFDGEKIAGKTWLRYIFMYNPMAIIITNARRILMYGEGIIWWQLGYVICCGGVTTIIGLLLITRFDRTYPKIG